MKRFTVILLLLGFVLQSLSGLTIITGFELHHDYIAQNLCINRNHPDMHCDGQCVLTKRLQKDHQRKDQDNENSGNRIVIFLYQPEKALTLPLVPSKINKHLFDNRKEQYHFIPLFGLLRPPQVIS